MGHPVTVLYRVSKKKLMPFQIQISRVFPYGTLSIPIGIQRTDRASLVELVYVLCTKSRSVLCIPMGIHRNEIRS